MAQRNIVLAGFMGVGKTTVGRLAAAQIGWRFVDTDALIEERSGRTIAQIFAQEGESAFRQLEAVIAQELAAQPRRVIAVGGGTLVNPRLRERLARSSLIICLTCDLEEIIRRVGHDPARPLFAPDREQLARLLQSRAGHYASLPYHVDATHLTPQQTAAEVIHLWQES